MKALSILLLTPLLHAQQPIPESIDRERSCAEPMISEITKYTDDQLLAYAAGLDLPDNVTRTLYPYYLERKTLLEGMRHNGLGKSHPTYLAAEKELQEMKGELDKALAQMRPLLQAKIDQANARAKLIAVKRAAAKPPDEARSADYRDAKRTYESELRMLQMMKSRLAGLETAPTTDPSLLELKRTIREQEDLVEQARKLLAAIAKAKGIIDKPPVDLHTPLLPASPPPPLPPQPAESE